MVDGPTPAPTPVPGAVAPQPPPISGGTLLITRDDKTAVAADPDRDVVWLADLKARSLRKGLKLQKGAEPGRSIEDADGKIHVVLRGLGQVIKLDPLSGQIESTRTVCPAPRGMAYDAASDNLFVACTGGELVRMKARGGDPQTAQIEGDLRDVAFLGTGATARLMVSRFKSAELLAIDNYGTLVGRTAPRPQARDAARLIPASTPSTAWRIQSMPDGKVLMLHQRGSDDPIVIKPGGYGGGGCKSTGVVASTLSLFSGLGSTEVGLGTNLQFMGLVVDVAVSRDGTKLAAISPSTRLDPTTGQVMQLSTSLLASTDPCPVPGLPTFRTQVQLTAGAFDGSNQLWVQSREPAQLMQANGTVTIPFDGAESMLNEGHRLFHEVTPALVACASCHPEGNEDGRVWNFSGIGARRTQTLRGGLLATAPFHWDGDLANLGALMGDVFVKRMSGPQPTAQQVTAFGDWLDRLPVLPRGGKDPEAVARGEAVFRDPGVGCISCHNGPRFTDNTSRDVGTGKAFQVPTLLGIGSRAPFMHTGCAPTLRDRFKPECGGGDAHGKTSQLTSEQLDDLVTYLETL